MSHIRNAMRSCLVLLVLIALSSVLALAPPVVKPARCIVAAPYVTSQPLVQLAIEKAVNDGQVWYQNRLTRFAENANLLSSAERQQALAELMAVFCTGSAFKGFIGITPDGALYTNRTVVASLFNGFPSGTSVTFKAIATDQTVTITGGNLRTVYANTTGSIALIAKMDSFGPNPNLFLGHYQNEWTINTDGSVCISRFHDGALKWFSLTATELLYVPWDF